MMSALRYRGPSPGIATAVEKARITGTIVVVGMTKEPHPVDLSAVFAKELTIRGVRIHSQYSFIGAIELLKDGALNEEFRTMISKVFPMEQTEEAFAFAQVPGDYFKVLIEM